MLHMYQTVVISPFCMSVFVRVYVICSFNKESRTVFLFTACIFATTSLWFTNGLCVIEKMSGTCTSLFCLPFGSL